MLDTISESLSETALSALLVQITWALPNLQALHILALAPVMISVWLLNLRVLGWKGSARSIPAVTAHSLPWLWSGVIVLALSGGLLVVAEPAALLGSTTFQLKMLLLAVALAVTFGMRHAVRSNAGLSDAAAKAAPGLRLAAIVSMVLWIVIAFAGRLIAYT